MKRPDLIVLIAVWEFLCALGIFLLIAGVATAFFFSMPGMWMWGDSLWREAPRIGGFTVFILGVVLLVMIAYFILALLGGIGILQGKEWGRILSIVQAALSVFWAPVGTVIGILILIYLTKPELKEYFS